QCLPSQAKTCDDGDAVGSYNLIRLRLVSERRAVQDWVAGIQCGCENGLGPGNLSRGVYDLCANIHLVACERVDCTATCIVLQQTAILSDEVNRKWTTSTVIYRDADPARADLIILQSYSCARIKIATLHCV